MNLHYILIRRSDFMRLPEDWRGRNADGEIVVQSAGGFMPAKVID